MAKGICCGHDKDSHYGSDTLNCNEPGCPCVKFIPEEAETPPDLKENVESDNTDEEVAPIEQEPVKVAKPAKRRGRPPKKKGR